MKRPDNSTIITTLSACGGIVLHAAERLGVARQTVHAWIAADPELKAAHDGVSEELLDLAESNVVTKIRAGDFDASKFYLRSKGRARGWGEHTKIEATVSTTVTNPVPRVDYSMYTLEELEHLERLLAKGEQKPASN